MVVHGILWEFRVRRGCERKFERAYGRNGDWARLFRKGRGYLGTWLLRDPKHKRRYLVVDLWTTRTAFLRFKKRWAESYSALDKACESLTKSETRLATFSL